MHSDQPAYLPSATKELLGDAKELELLGTLAILEKRLACFISRIRLVCVGQGGLPARCTVDEHRGCKDARLKEEEQSDPRKKLRRNVK